MEFIKTRSNLLSRDQVLLSRDRICYLNMEYAKSGTNFATVRSNLLSRDWIC